MADPARYDWSLLRSFVAVLDAGSVMGGARRLGALQPTVSRHIAELEAQLGTPLFERTGRGAVPTAAALAIADAAREVQAAAEQLSHRLALRSVARGGSVRVSASHVVATWLLPGVIAAMQRDEPDIQIELVASDGLSNLLRREADIAVRMVRPRQATLVARKLGEVPLVAAAHRSYLRRAGTPKRPEDLLAHRLVGFDRDDGIVRGFAAMGHAMTREQFAVRTDDQVTYGRLVAEGAGIGFIARYQLALWPDVVPLLPALKVPSLPCWLVVHREIRGNPVVRRVYDALAQALPPLLAAGA